MATISMRWMASAAIFPSCVISSPSKARARDGRTTKPLWLPPSLWLPALAGRLPAPPADRRKRSAHDQLHERHDVASQGRDDHAPQRLDEQHRRARPHADDGSRSLSLDVADVPRQRLDVCLDRDRRRWHARVPAQGGADRHLRSRVARTDHDAVRGPHHPDRPGQCAGGGQGVRATRVCTC